MAVAPAEGERRAAGGYRAQYLVGAHRIIEALQSGDLEWIRVADPEAGRVDDLQIGTTGRIDAYQVKWSRHVRYLTLGGLVGGSASGPPLVEQLADGWQELAKRNPGRRVVVHLATNWVPSPSSRAMPDSSSPPVEYHLAAFIEQAWLPTQRGGSLAIQTEWQGVWEAIRAASGLEADEFQEFVMNCSLDLGSPRPEETDDALAICSQLFEIAASAEHVVELKYADLVRRLRWTRRYEYRNIHSFPDPQFRYCPIEETAEAVRSALRRLPGGYIGVFGPPGSGKSTLLTCTLRVLEVLLVQYYAYVPDARDPSELRGESASFLHDITLRLWNAGVGPRQRPDSSDRMALARLLHDQLRSLGKEHSRTSAKTVILVDGLDHIHRELRPERSLLCDLPVPQAIPNGVYFIVGSQTDELPDLPSRVQEALGERGRRIVMGQLTRIDVEAISGQAVPALTANQRQQVYDRCDGYPLVLVYLLKQLCHAEGVEELDTILQAAIPYQGDIEEHYSAHWYAVRDEADLVHGLGLMARVRGPIPMGWFATWLETASLARIRTLFVPYFEQQRGDRPAVPATSRASRSRFRRPLLVAPQDDASPHCIAGLVDQPRFLARSRRSLASIICS